MHKHMNMQKQTEMKEQGNGATSVNDLWETENIQSYSHEKKRLCNHTKAQKWTLSKYQWSTLYYNVMYKTMYMVCKTALIYTLWK